VDLTFSACAGAKIYRSDIDAYTLSALCCDAKGLRTQCDWRICRRAAFGGRRQSGAYTTPMYWMYEMAQASLNPARAVTDADQICFKNPLNRVADRVGKSIAPAANCSSGRRAVTANRWGPTTPRSMACARRFEISFGMGKPFCRLLYFDRKLTRPV